jgi:hypothetical protein
MAGRLRKTRSSAFRANATFASPSKGSSRRPIKKLKLDRARSLSKPLRRKSADEELESGDEEESIGESVEENDEDQVVSDSSLSESMDGQENVDPVNNSSVTNGVSRRKLRNGKSVLRSQNRVRGHLKSRGEKRQTRTLAGYSPRKRKRDDPEYTDDDEPDQLGDSCMDDGNEASSPMSPIPSNHPDEGSEQVEEDVGNSSEPDYIDESKYFRVIRPICLLCQRANAQPLISTKTIFAISLLLFDRRSTFASGSSYMDLASLEKG